MTEGGGRVNMCQYMLALFCLVVQQKKTNKQKHKKKQQQNV